MTSLQKRRIFRGTDPRVAITKKFIEKSIDNFDVHVYHSLSAEQTTTNYTPNTYGNETKPSYLDYTTKATKLSVSQTPILIKGIAINFSFDNYFGDYDGEQTRASDFNNPSQIALSDFNVTKNSIIDYLSEDGNSSMKQIISISYYGNQVPIYNIIAFVVGNIIVLLRLISQQNQ